MGSVRSTSIDTQAPSTCCFLPGGSTDELLCGCLLRAATASRVCVCCRTQERRHHTAAVAARDHHHCPPLPTHDDRVAIGPTSPLPRKHDDHVVAIRSLQMTEISFVANEISVRRRELSTNP